MSPEITLHINKPCHQDWTKMSLQEKGRHCALCDKTVTDFSLWSDKQIIAYLKQSHTEVCGRLQSHQLDRNLDLKKSKKEISKIKLVFTFLTSFWIGTNVKAQGKVTVAHNLITQQTKRDQIHPKEFSKKDSVSLSGFVKDQRGNAVGGAIISVNGIGCCITDSHGHFNISKTIIPQEDSIDIAISALGYAITYMKQQVDHCTKMNVVLNDIEIAGPAKEYNLGRLLEGTIGGVSIKKRSFVGRFISSLKSAITMNN